MKLKELRMQRGLTQQQLADEISIERALVARYENGSRKPPIEKLNMLADYFGVSVDFLLGREEDEQKNSSDPKAAAIEKLSKVASQLSPEHIELLTQHAQFLQGSQKDK